MFSLIYYQIRKHKKILFFLLLVWLIEGYIIYKYRNITFSYLSDFFSSPSLPKVQKPKKAYPYWQSAEARLKKHNIDLKRMAESCNLIPLTYKGSYEQFKTDILESQSKQFITQKSLKAEGKNKFWESKFPLYWQKNQPYILENLKDLADALAYAYEINLHQIDKKYKKEISILIPEYFSKNAKAICSYEKARLVWLKYITFQEKRAQKWQRLKGNQKYIYSLFSYLGTAPLFLKDKVAYCNPKNSGLSCSSPQEAIATLKKLFVIQSNVKKGIIHFQIGQAYVLENSFSSFSKAIEHFSKATQFLNWQIDGEMAIAMLWIEKENYLKALVSLRKLQKFRKNSSFKVSHFNHLARVTLTGLERNKDADCFSDIGLNLSARQKYCLALKL